VGGGESPDLAPHERQKDHGRREARARNVAPPSLLRANSRERSVREHHEEGDLDEPTTMPLLRIPNAKPSKITPVSR
jgi:hypothetical protein